MSRDERVLRYRAKPYTREVGLIEEDGRAYFLARIKEMPWVRIHGESREEALMRLDEIFDDAILSLLEAGDEIPEPEAWPSSYGEPPAGDASDPRRYRRPGRVTYQRPEDMGEWEKVGAGGAELEPAAP